MPPSTRRLGPILFAVALVALAALAIHWVFLIWQHETTGISRQEKGLSETAHDLAFHLGRRPAPPLLGPVANHPDLEVVALTRSATPPGSVRLRPRFGELALRIRPEVLDELRAKRRRRSVMMLGEGVLALLLFGVTAAMLLRLLTHERQRRAEFEAFVSTVSHELKTPLAGIKALLGTLQAGNIPPDRIREFLEMGLREADRLEHSVENLLLANRLRRSALEVQLRPLPVREFLGEFLRHRSALLPDGHAGLEVVGPEPADLAVMADADKLRVVLENLTDNALKYGDPAHLVRLAARAEGPDVRLDVEDQGIGFDPAHAESLFEGVRRATEDQTALIHGTGLGLSIARGLARAMGGDLTAESRGVGQGSRFTVRLRRTEGV
jgi:signal transduction histidine kinase